MRTYWPYVLYCLYLTVLPCENVLTNWSDSTYYLHVPNFRISRSTRDWQFPPVRICVFTCLYRLVLTPDPPSLPRWRPGVFSRNSLEKGFREFSAGGIWREQWNFPFPKGPCGHCLSRTRRNLGQEWSPIMLSVGCRPGAVHPIFSSTQIFEWVSNPIRATNHDHCWP